jgi:hypothetical protein
MTDQVGDREMTWQMFSTFKWPVYTNLRVADNRRASVACLANPSDCLLSIREGVSLVLRHRQVGDGNFGVVSEAKSIYAV